MRYVRALSLAPLMVACCVLTIAFSAMTLGHAAMSGARESART